MFDNFCGNLRVVRALELMIEQDRIPQTLLLAGPEGVGKATLARRFAARLLGRADLIEKDDLSRPENQALIEEREKWPAERRAEEPLIFASHPDFVTFPPEGPLRQITIQQMRLLRERAQYLPQKGTRRVFLVDQLDRANEQAANSLLKTLEEPPPYLILIITAQNAQDLLPTIRSRAVPFHLSPLSAEEMRRFVAERNLDHPELRAALAGGSPGTAVSLDLADYERRRESMLALVRTAAGIAPFDRWLEHSELIAARRDDKLEDYLRVLYLLLADLLALSLGRGPIRNTDVIGELENLARRISLDWIRAAVARTDRLLALARRNIQKSLAFDYWLLERSA